MRSVSQARLNQTAFAPPVPSAISASRMVSRRRRVGAQLRRSYLHLHRRLLPQLQLPEPHRLGPVAVAVRQVAEKVPEGADPDLGSGLGELRTGPP